MAFIRVIDEDEAEGRLAEIYDQVAQSRGKVANILKVHSLAPETMAAHLAFYKSVMFDRPGIGRRQRELIGTVVSRANGCEYCTRHHAEALCAYVKDRELVERIAADPATVELEPADRAIVDYALALTHRPAEMDESHVEPLRQAGFTDEEILSIALVTSYFNFVNRVAQGLGVRFDEDELRGYLY